MLSRKQYSPVIGATIVAFYFSTAACRAADHSQWFDSGQPHDLINQPICWSTEQPDPSRNCDFAQKT